MDPREVILTAGEGEEETEEDASSEERLAASLGWGE